METFTEVRGWLSGSAFGLEYGQWVGLLLLVLLVLPTSRFLERALLAFAGRAARWTHGRADDQLVASAKGPLRLCLIAVLAFASSRVLQLHATALDRIRLVASSLVLSAIAWYALRLIRVVASLLEARVVEAGAPEERLRAVRTQIAVLRRVADAVVYVVGVSALLLQLDTVRSIGVSLLASAGIAGLVLGLAAQKSISTLLAGIQLSITQPMRLGDTVIVENEWGWIEEITLTYVVVKVWDLRRLVVPMSYFLDRPFQNWSRAGGDIMGTVEVHADYRLNVRKLREELTRVLRDEAGPLWDGKVAGIQVTDTRERTMLVRALVSSTDAGKNWDLRCLVRERLVEWIAAQPNGLPVLRAETHGDGDVLHPRNDVAIADGRRVRRL